LACTDEVIEKSTDFDVQVFGRRSAKIIHALWRSVFEKRQGNVVVQPPLGGFDPGFEPVTFPVLYPDQHNPCRLREQNVQVAIACLEILLRIVRSPVEICVGTSPSQAPKSRPLENRLCNARRHRL
jgi:hypothetical protein